MLQMDLIEYAAYHLFNPAVFAQWGIPALYRQPMTSSSIKQKSMNDADAAQQYDRRKDSPDNC